jgi:hypothetical protein
VILILLSNPTRMRESKKVELIVSRSAFKASGSRCGERRGDFHEIVPG